MSDQATELAKRFADDLKVEARIRRAAANIMDGRTREARDHAKVSALLALAAATIDDLARRHPVSR